MKNLTRRIATLTIWVHCFTHLIAYTPCHAVIIEEIDGSSAKVTSSSPSRSLGEQQPKSHAKKLNKRTAPTQITPLRVCATLLFLPALFTLVKGQPNEGLHGIVGRPAILPSSSPSIAKVTVSAVPPQPAFEADTRADSSETSSTQATNLSLREEIEPEFIDAANPDLMVFLPQDSSNDYIKRANTALQTILRAGQKPIQDNVRTSHIDHGYAFPPHLNVLSYLLDFCTRDTSSPRHMLDVGAAYGYESILATLTGRVTVDALDIYDAQVTEMRKMASSILKPIDPDLLKKFTARNLNILSQKVPTNWQGRFHILNANKVFHFLSEQETLAFLDKAYEFLSPGGRLFLTCLTPDEGSELEAYLNRNRDRYTCPGLVRYETTLSFSGAISSERNIRRSKDDEHPGLFREKIDRQRMQSDITRAMHFHDAETLSRLLKAHNFRVLTHFTYKSKSQTERFIFMMAEKPLTNGTTTKIIPKKKPNKKKERNIKRRGEWRRQKAKDEL